MTDIQNLLDKYWEGETTLQEEAELRRYFDSGNVASQHEHIAGLFIYQSMLSKQTSRMDAVATRQSDDSADGARVVSMRPSKWLVNVAAVACVLLAVVWMMRPADSHTDAVAQVVLLDEQAETEAAIEATREALAFLSGALDRNTRTIRKHVKQAEKADIFR